MAAFALLFGLAACGGDDDAPAEDAATETTSRTEGDQQASETTAEATTTTAAAEADLPTIDAASLDPCSLVDKAEADRVLGGATTQEVAPETPGRRTCVYFIDKERFIESSVRGFPSSADDMSTLRSSVDENCDVEDAQDFGPSAFRAQACDGSDTRALYVLVDGGTIALAIGAADAPADVLDELMSTALERAA